MKKLLTDKKNQLLLLLSILFLIKIPQEEVRFTLWVLGGIIIAMISDVLIKRLFFRKKIVPTSAAISGFIVAGIINYQQPWFVLVIFSLLAIISKNVIKHKNRHVFNPANFALFVATAFGVPLTWSIEFNVYIIIVFGVYMAYSIRKLTHVLGFLVLFSSLCLLKDVNPLMLVSWFFVFVMLIEPKTSGAGYLRGAVFGCIAGVVSFIVFTFFPRYDFFVSGLFVANLISGFKPKIH